ncbi:MAG TPA: lysylphosphatidylglycerol synthase transmembrane domain-containing protein [Longimicrobiaceae bacterium]|nr:lysylphosphatidylglycerol synthase transmembrane domain-containing protein [Longimicrobiaceae bacterium]
MTRTDRLPTPTPPEPPAPDPVEPRWREEVAEVEAEASRAPRPHWIRWIVVLALLGLAVHLLLPQLADLRQTARVLRTLRPWLVALAVGVELVSYVALAFMMRRIVALAGQLLTMNRAFGVTLAAGSVGLIAGGLAGIGGSSYRWLREAGIRPEGALLAGWLPTLLNAATMAVFALVGMGVLLLARALTAAQAAAFGISFGLLAGAAGFLLWATRHREGAKRIAARMQARVRRLFRRPPGDPAHLHAVLDRLYDAFHVLRARGWKGPVVGAVLGVVFDMTAMGLLFAAAHNPLTPDKLLAGYAIPLLLGKVAVVPGGLGVVEAMMIALYTGFGVPAATAVTVVLSFRVIAFWMPNLLGFGIIPLLQIPTRRTGRDLPGPPPPNPLPQQPLGEGEHV